MSVKSGRFFVKRNGVEVPASASWEVGPVIDNATPQGSEATVTWHDVLGITAVDRDYTQDNPDGDEVEIWWRDEDGESRVFTGYVDSSAGRSLQETRSDLTDGIRRLERSLDLRPVAWTLPVHPELSGAGGLPRRVGLFGVWFTHQAMTHAGFDPGVPMHWSAVAYASNCGSAAMVPHRFHAYASCGELRQAYRLSSAALTPQFPQGDTQRVAADIYQFGVTSPLTPEQGSLASEPWQVTWDMGTRVVDPTYGSQGEFLLRNLSTAAGVVVEWNTTQVIVRRHNADNTRVTLGTYARGTNARFSLVVAPSGSNVILRGDVSGTIASGLTLGTTLPTGVNGLCTFRVMSPGMIGSWAITRGDRLYMTQQAPKGRIYRHSLSAMSLPGFPYVKGTALRLLTDQAQAEVGMRAQPIWQWIDESGLLINTDFESLAAQEVAHTFDTRPGDGLALELLEWQTRPGTAFSSVEVEHTRASVRLTERPALLLAEERAESLMNGDEYELFLHPRSGEFWIDPDIRPLMAGYPYRTGDFPLINRVALNVGVKSFVGGNVVDEETGDRRGWMQPHHFGWTVQAGTGVVLGAMEMLDPDTVKVSGVISGLASGDIGSTSPDQGSEGLWERRKHMDFPQLRGPARGTLRRLTLTTDIEGVDSRHGPCRHDTGLWVQQNTAVSRIASNLRDAIVNPVPLRTVQVEATGRVKAGQKIAAVERRPDGLVITEEIVVGRLRGDTTAPGDAMTVQGVVTKRTEVQTDPNGPEPGDGGSWETPPPVVDPIEPPSNRPPPWEGDPPITPPPAVLPGKPSTPQLATSQRGITVTWDGLLAAGGSAVGANYGYTEVAIERGVNPPTTIAGSMYFKDVWQFTYPLFIFSGTWHCRIRTVDLWGQPGPWSDVATITDVQGGNLLDNPQTEPGQGGWGGYEPVELTEGLFGSHPTGGSGVLRGHGDGTNHPFGVNRWVPCEEGEAFDLECWFRRNSTGSGSGDDAIRLCVVTRSGNGAAQIWNMGGFDRTELPLGKWVRFAPAFPAVAPAGAVEMRFEVWLMGDLTSGTIDATACSMVSRGI